MPFVDRLVHWANECPDRAAVVLDGQRLSYAELRRRALDLCLPEPAAFPGGRMVAVDLGSTVDFVVAITAIIGRGCAAAVLDPAWPDHVRTAALEQLGIGTVVTLTGQPDWGDSGGRTRELTDSDSDRVFYCGFTSGTTRTPKAFARTVGSWRRSLERSTRHFGTASGDSVLVPGPLSASLSLYALAECLYAGATFYGQPAPDTAEALELLSVGGITQLVAVPSQLRMLGLRARHGWPFVRTVISGGAKLGDDDVLAIQRLAPAAVLHEYYGASELSFVAAGLAATGDGPRLVGAAFPGVELRIESLNNAGAAAVGEPGIIWVRSDMTCQGYLAGDDGISFRRDGDWATVGDVGWLDDSGQLHVAGRSSDMIVTAGFNVYPHEIEDVLRTYGLDAVVVGLPDGLRGTSVAAVIHSSGPPDQTAGKLRELCAGELAQYKVPRRFYWVREWPRQHGGKISRRDLVEAIETAGAGIHVLG